MAVMRAVVIRLMIGVGIAVAGVIASVVTRNWSIEYNWFGMLGMILLGVAAILMFSPGVKRSSHGQHKPIVGNEIHWGVTLFLIGIVNFFMPIFIYYLFHPSVV